MLNVEKVKELRNEFVEADDLGQSEVAKFAWNHAVSLMNSLEYALQVVEAAKKLVVHCNHKPEGWNELDSSLKPFQSEEA